MSPGAAEKPEPAVEPLRLELGELALPEDRHDVPTDRPGVLVERGPVHLPMFGRKPYQLEETGHGLAIATALTGQRLRQRRLGLLPRPEARHLLLPASAGPARP